MGDEMTAFNPATEAEKDGWITLYATGLDFPNPPAPPQKPALTLIEGRGKERHAMREVLTISIAVLISIWGAHVTYTAITTKPGILTE